MTVTVTSALAGPATARYSNVYGALVDLGVLSGLGAQDVTGSGDPVAPILNASQFYAPLTHSLILTRGTGDPTFTRATSAWEFDNEGKLITVPSGAARFGGARMVRNLLAATSTLSTQNVTTVATSYTLSFYGTGSVTLSGTATGTLNGTGASNRVQTTVTATAGTLTLTVSGSVTDAQLENVTGQADQTASEYVSVGVLSAPYHGAGVGGVEWFDTNKDGSAIAASSLLGYHPEWASTNSLLYSRDLRLSQSTAAMAGGWKSVGIGSELITNGTFDTDTGGWTFEEWGTGGSAVVSSGQVTITAGTGNTYLYQTISTVAGKLYRLSFYGIATNDRYNINISGTGYSASELGFVDVIYAGANPYSLMFVASGATTYISLRARTNSFSVTTFDNISVKEAEVQVTTCIGIDNAANSASTLTAGAADATILQTLSLAAAARSSSAYVKRRTGTGNIYMTRDGGTNWTDITASVGSSWARVKIENTSVLNPSVGFKIATSGDEIDVDVCQDEAGASISSPIITTTAAVTRNAHDETFQAASNWSDTAGWALATVQGESWANATGTAIGNGTNGLKLSASNSGIVAYDGTNTVNGPAGSPSGAEKLAMTWGSGALQAASGGVAGSAGSYDGAWGLATVGIGTSQGNVYIKDVYIGQSALTAAQLQQVTA